MVGLNAVSLATETSSLDVGSVTSMAEISRPRYDCPTLKLWTSGNAESAATIFSDSSGPMTWSHVTRGGAVPFAAVLTFDGIDAPVFFTTRFVRASFRTTVSATRSTWSYDSAVL